MPTVIYCATREKDLEYSRLSINSVRKLYPEIEILLFTNTYDYKNDEVNEVVFLRDAKTSYSDKILSLIKAERKNILFLDCDTYLLEPIEDLFLLLNRFEIAITHSSINQSLQLDMIPQSFPEFNTGVILLKKNVQTQRFLKNWYNLYFSLESNHKEYHDQPAFRLALYNSKLAFFIFKSEYNCRFTIGSIVSDKIRILHGKNENIHKTANILKRIFNEIDSDSSYIKYVRYSIFTIIKHRLVKFLNMICKRGFL